MSIVSSVRYSVDLQCLLSTYTVGGINSQGCLQGEYSAISCSDWRHP